jgi:hypothetical protein
MIAEGYSISFRVYENDAKLTMLKIVHMCEYAKNTLNR